MNATTPAVQSPQPGPAPSVRVLIADDHPVVRQGLKMMLSSDPEVNVVGEARDGDEALDMVHNLDWDVAVLDYSMPGRGGVDLLAAVKHDYPERPVLIPASIPRIPMACAR